MRLPDHSIRCLPKYDARNVSLIAVPSDTLAICRRYIWLIVAIKSGIGLYRRIVIRDEVVLINNLEFINKFQLFSIKLKRFICKIYIDAERAIELTSGYPQKRFDRSKYNRFANRKSGK